MGNLSAGFDLIKEHQKALLIDGSAFSVRCVLSDGTTEQGKGATLPTTDPLYDATDELKGLPAQIGVAVDAEGLPIMADSAEFLLNMESVTIGTIIEGWTLSFWNYDGEKKYRIAAVIRDKTLGVYRLQLQLKKAVGKGTKISREDKD